MFDCLGWIAITAVIIFLVVVIWGVYSLFFYEPQIEEEDIWLDLWKETDE